MAKQRTDLDLAQMESMVKNMESTGLSYRDIAAELGTTHATVTATARRLGWIAQNFPTDPIAETRKSLTDSPRSGHSSLTLPNFESVLESLRQGCTLSTAAARARLTPQTLSNWRKDSLVKAALDAAMLESLGDAEIAVYDAHQRGDWKAAIKRLETHPLTRDEYQTESDSVGIQVIINVDRTGGESVTIDGKAEAIDA